MAYNKLLQPVEILKTALALVESNGSHELSLRAVATALGVKAPSLYRYFSQKEALEVAVAEEACSVLLARLQVAAIVSGPEGRFRATAEAYLSFARERAALYAFIAERIPQTYGLPASKAVWNMLLEAASAVSGQPDDTGAAVATWSFLHGYALLERSGAFGGSGPQGGLERGISAFLAHLGTSAQPLPKVRTRRKAGTQRNRQVSC